MAARKPRKTAARPKAGTRRKAGTARRAGDAGRSLLPVFLSGCILFCIGVFVYLGYKSVTASHFFEVVAVEVTGTDRSSRENIERIVHSQTEMTGVWNADLIEMKARIEKLPFVKSAAISRVLPSGVRVEIFEHEPKAIVKTQNGNILVDEAGQMIAKAGATDEKLRVALAGWDEAKSEKADKENAERVKVYLKMLADWKAYGVEDRVKMIDLADLRDPCATVEDSGTSVRIAVGRDNFGENLTRGIKAIAGKGQTFEAVDLVGTNMILSPRRTQ